ncbi:MAG TPA: hypothetical protein VFV62_02885 [Gaiellaceae bacterium]|nr:hypothetical protein [Gaiellaceae bacterium]
MNAAEDLDAEREVDLRSVWERIAARWWLPLLGVVAGLLIGFVLALGGGQVYKAETLVYLGQPFTPNGGGAIPNSLATNPRLVAEVVRAEAALKEASRASGIRVGALRGRISTAPVVATGQAKGTTTLFQIAVQGSAPRKVERAADSLAKHVTSISGRYVEGKIETLEEQIANDEKELEGINSRFNIAASEQAAALANRSLPVTERLLIITSLNSTLSALEQRRSTIQEDLLAARQLMTLATEVEQARIVEPATAAKTTARSGRNAALVGALIGLLLGCAAALLADPFLARRARTA